MLPAALLCSLHPVYIVNEVPSDEDVEDCRAPDTVVLSQVQVVADALQDLCLPQDVPVVGAVPQAVDVCLDFHCPNFLSHKIRKAPVSLPTGMGYRGNMVSTGL